ncbi:MAG: hypothetical protein J1G30_01160 [Spirochaetales bacterium]|nr:hypothetical protein [Spirochaetales bacterium]
MVKQTDSEIGFLELVPGVSVRDYGCLTIALFNILQKHERCKSGFTDFLNAIKTAGGYTKEGLLRWDAVKVVCGMEHRMMKLSDSFRSEDRYEYIVQIPYKSTGHFCEVKYISKSGLIIYADSYDGVMKEIERRSCLSVRELMFI